MKVSYEKKNLSEPQANEAAGNDADKGINWRKLGYNDKPEIPEEPKPTKPDVPGILPDQSPKQLSELHDPISVDPESTFIHQKIKSKREAMDWVLSMLGYPLVTAELTEEHLNTAFANAIQLYTEYAYFPDQYILETSANYKKGVGLDLSKYNVSGVKEISVGNMNLWFMEWPFFTNRSGYMGSGTLAGSFITFQAMIEFKDMVRRVCALDHDFLYSRFTKLLTLIPEPPIPPGPPAKLEDERKKPRGVPIVLTVQVEPPVWELYGDMMVRRLALAYAKIILGQIRGKFEGITLPGGGNISKEIGAEGKEELEKLDEKLRQDRSRGQNWYFV